MVEPTFEDAVAIIEYGLHLRMYGECAPGGDETWHDWDIMTETFIRALHEKKVEAA